MDRCNTTILNLIMFFICILNVVLLFVLLTCFFVSQSTPIPFPWLLSHTVDVLMGQIDSLEKSLTHVNLSGKYVTNEPYFFPIVILSIFEKLFVTCIHMHFVRSLFMSLSLDWIGVSCYILVLI